MDINSAGNQVLKMRARPLIFLDIETSGLRVQRHEIIEIGVLKVMPKPPFNIVAELEMKVKPKHPERGSKDAYKINGYCAEQWQNALNLEEALAGLDEFGKEGILVGYNISFDWAFLDKAYFSLSKIDPFYYHRLDVMPMAYIKLYSKKKISRFSLGEVCKYFKIDRGNKHRALDDAKSTYLVFKKLFEIG